MHNKVILNSTASQLPTVVILIVLYADKKIWLRDTLKLHLCWIKVQNV